jgi:hypothetical protein
VTRRFRHIEWTLRRLDFWGARAYVQCVSGSPQCGAAPPAGSEGRTDEGSLRWAESHFRETGHRRFDRALFETVQWDPPEDVDPRTLPGVTT